MCFTVNKPTAKFKFGIVMVKPARRHDHVTIESLEPEGAACAAGLQVADDGQESEGDERVARYKQQAAHLTARAQEHRTGHISS